MLKITFPDGNQKKYKPGITGLDIASDISLSLSKMAIAIFVNGDQKDLSDPINEDAIINIITLKDESGLEIMRHTVAAQVLARAIKNIYPQAKLAIGPTIENGFYYDVLLNDSISSDDLSTIEEEMKKIVKEGHLINKKVKDKNEAIKLFEELEEPYKIQIIKDSLQENDFQIYQQGETNFFDLCRGPHLPSLKLIG